jgi:hypothetical protein
VLLEQGSRPQRDTARELRIFSQAGLIPLWVVSPSGHWATCWSPDESVVVVRHNPVDPQSN